MINIFAIIASLLVSPAAAQCNGTFPNGTVCGNYSGSTAPPGAVVIPGGGGGGGSGSAFIARAQIPSTNTGGNSFISSGYRTANDLGYGAPYICTGQTSTSFLAIQDSAGNWCGLNLAATDQINIGWFGAYADDGSTKITAPDISANPWWRQSPVYSVGTSWDTVAVQEAKYAAYAVTSLPNSMPAAGSWNAGVGNKTFFVPNGTFGINAQIYSHQQGFIDLFASKGHAIWDWIGASDTIMWLCDSCTYGQIFNLSIEANTIGNTPSSNPVPLVSLDNVGSGNSSGLKTQQLTLYDMFCSVNQNGACIEVSRSGGGAQGDTVTYINPVWLGFASSAALMLGGNNALEHVIVNGDCQGFWAGSCIWSNGGSFSLYGTHFENQNTDQLNYSPVLYQASVLGADVSSPGGVATEVSTINGARSEGDILLYNSGGGPVDIFSSETIGADLFDWFQDFPYMTGAQVHPTVNNTKGRNFLLVDGGGTGWRTINTSTSTSTTLVDSDSPGWTINQWAGYDFQYRFASSGFTFSCGIASSTANSITSDPGCGTPFSSNVPSTVYSIVGKTALNASEPNWDSATTGHFVKSGDTGQGFVTQAGSNQVGIGSGIESFTNANSTYYLIPGADAMVITGGYTLAMPLMVKVTAVAGPCSFSPAFANCATVSTSAAFSVGSNSGGGAAGFGGTPIADAQGKMWLDAPWRAANPRILHGYDGNGRSFVDGANLISSLGAGLFTTATIASCNSNLNGSQIVVSDATAPNPGSVYAGGGAITTPVVCNGTNWITPGGNGATLKATSSMSTVTLTASAYTLANGTVGVTCTSPISSATFTVSAGIVTHC